MRVLLLTDRFPPQRGGVAVSAERHARWLGPCLERLDVLHLTADLPPGASESEEREGYTVRALGRAAREEDSLALLELAAVRCGADLVHGFYAVPTGFVAVLAARRLGVPSVVSLRGNDVDRGLFGRTAMLQWTLQHADRVLAVSRELAARAAAFAGRDDVVFTPNSVDAERFAPGARAEDLGEGAVVLFAGEMRFKKGLTPLLEAAPRLPEVRFVLAGGVRKDDRGAFLRLRPPNVVELPYARDVERLRALYGRADLVVLPALFEGMPNALLEAMACARPVLATAVGGVPDLIRHGETGWLMQPEELPHLASRIRQALASGEPVGARARQHVLRHFRPEAERDRVLEVYRTRVSKAAPPSSPAGERA